MIKLATINIQVLRFMYRFRYFRNLFLYDLSRIERAPDSRIHSIAVTQVKTPDAPIKQTMTGRFQGLDYFLSGLLCKSRQYAVHDVAVSNGVTSMELYNVLAKAGFTFSMTISDRYSVLRLYKVLGIPLMCNQQGEFIYANLAGIACMPDLSWLFFFSKGAGLILRSVLRAKLWAGLAFSSEEVSLVYREVRSMVDEGKISYINYDVFTTELLDLFDVVRCMNLLNKDYFSPEQISCAIRNMSRSLREEGILQIGRTYSDGTHRTSFYVRNGGQIKIVNRLNDGFPDFWSDSIQL